MRNLKILGKLRACKLGAGVQKYSKQSHVEDDVLNLFEGYEGKSFASERSVHRFLDSLGLTAKQLRKRCVEGCRVGFISEKRLKPGQVLLSDRAGQFAVFNHAGCWVHMERPLRKIVPSSAQVEKELHYVQDLVWRLYRTLKEPGAGQAQRVKVNELYDLLVTTKSVSPKITTVISNFATYRHEMLKVLDYPGLPLHNNDSERDLREVARRRNISGSTKTSRGRKFRDGLLSLRQTCYRLGYNFWEFLLRWCRGQPPDLAALVRQRYQTAHA